MEILIFDISSVIVTNLLNSLRLSKSVATTGRPGPVLVDIPKDIQFKKTEFVLKNKNKKNINGKANDKISISEIDSVINLMKKF